MTEQSHASIEEHQPTFSVIIATYNRAHLVGRAIRSVLPRRADMAR